MSTTTALHEAPVVPDIYDDPQLQLPGVDGHQVHRINLKITGAPDLDRSNPDDVHVFRDLKLGQRVRFVVEGYVVDNGAKATLTDAGAVDVVQGTKTIRVDSIRTGD